MQRNCYFLVPGLSEKFRTGGLMVLRDIADIFRNNLGFKADFVTTHEQHPDALSLEVLLQMFRDRRFSIHDSFFLVSWGPLVQYHIKLIRKKIPDARILYYAQSFGWNIKVPANIPIICVSRYVMAQWAFHAPEHYLAHIPPPLHKCFYVDEKTPRDIDILVHTRKQNNYCLNMLIPALRNTHMISEIKGWLPQKEFASLLRRTKIFLYLTELHKAGFLRRLPGEGFGLPALEAIACGACVGSNLLGGVTDFLTPGENCIKLQNGNIDIDVKLVEDALKKFSVNSKTAHEIRETYKLSAIAHKWQTALDRLGFAMT